MGLTPSSSQCSSAANLALQGKRNEAARPCGLAFGLAIFVIILILILILLLFQPSMAFSQSTAKTLAHQLAQIPPDDHNQRHEIIIKAIPNLEPLTKGCAEKNQHRELFEISPFIRGADTQEYLSEINGLAVMYVVMGAPITLDM